MRTTLNLDPQLLRIARRLAEARSVSLGDIITELANKGLEVQSEGHNKHSRNHKSDFPIFGSPKGAAPIGIKEVKQDED